MDRREFIKLCSLAGLGVASSQLPGTYLDANAAVGGDVGWFFFNATGGWDIFRVTDPKGNVANSDGVVINDDFDSSGIATVDGTEIRYPFQDLQGNPIGNNQEFFDTAGPMMTVINGQDTETNGHDTGQRNAFAGRLAENTPCLPALIAAVQGGAKPLSFITNGGYDSTFGMPVSKTRLGDTNTLLPLIYPNRLNPQDETSQLFHTEETFGRIMATRQARLDDLQRQQFLPLVKNKMNLLYTARSGMGDLSKINDYLPEQLSQLGIERQAEIALAAFKAGLCQTATLTVGGFDSHGNNNQQQDQQRSELFQGVLRFLQRAEELAVTDKVVIVIGSDFGRTPQYNEDQGKDHFSVGTMLIIDPSGKIPGGRVFGATDEFGNYEKVDASGKPGGNIVIKNGTVHRWMRKYAGIDDSPLTSLYPINLEADELLEFA
jgi:hypothetical protein